MRSNEIVRETLEWRAQIGDASSGSLSNLASSKSIKGKKRRIESGVTEGSLSLENIQSSALIIA